MSRELLCDVEQLTLPETTADAWKKDYEALSGNPSGDVALLLLHIRPLQEGEKHYSTRADVMLRHHGLDPGKTISQENYGKARRLIAQAIYRSRPDVVAYAAAVAMVYDEKEEYLANPTLKNILEGSPEDDEEKFEYVKQKILDSKVTVPETIMDNEDLLFLLDEIEVHYPEESATQTPLSDICQGVAIKFLEMYGFETQRQAEVQKQIAGAVAEAVQVQQDEMAKLRQELEEIRAAQAQQTLTDAAQASEVAPSPTAAASEAEPPPDAEALAEARETIRQLQAEVTRLQALEDPITRAMYQLRGVLEIRDEVDVIDAVKALQAALKRKSDESDGYLGEKSRLQAQVDAIPTKIAQALAAHQKELDEAKASLATAEKVRNDAVLAEREAVRIANEQEFAGMRNQIAALESQLGVISEIRRTLGIIDEKANILNVVRALASAKEDLERQHANALAAKDAEIELATAAKTSAEGVLAQARQALETAEATISSQALDIELKEKNVTELEGKLAALKEELENEQTRLRELLETQTDKLREELEAAKAPKKYEEGTLDEANAKIATLQEQITQWESTVADLRARLDAKVTAVAAAGDANREQVIGLNERVTALTEEIRQAKEAYETLQRLLGNIRATLTPDGEPVIKTSEVPKADATGAELAIQINRYLEIIVRMIKAIGESLGADPANMTDTNLQELLLELKREKASLTVSVRTLSADLERIKSQPAANRPTAATPIAAPEVQRAAAAGAVPENIPVPLEYREVPGQADGALAPREVVPKPEAGEQDYLEIMKTNLRDIYDNWVRLVTQNPSVVQELKTSNMSTDEYIMSLLEIIRSTTTRNKATSEFSKRFNQYPVLCSYFGQLVTNDYYHKIKKLFEQ